MRFSYLAAILASTAIAVTAHASPIYTTTATVNYNPAAPTSNFATPTNANNETAYTVRTGADSSYFYVDLTATPPTSSPVDQFANIYIGGPTFSGIVINVTAQTFQRTGAGGPDYSLVGTGYTYSATTNDISFALPFAYLETANPGFTPFSPGDLIRISLSQSFGYSVAGGSTFYDPVNRLGAQTVPQAVAVTPEPETLTLVGSGLMFCEFMRRRLRRA